MVVHQQKIILLVCKYMAIYVNKINLNFKIQVYKYMRIHSTKKLQSTARNVYSTIHATAYKVLHKIPGLQEHVMDFKSCAY